jgi:hypothetical protein
MSEGHNTEHSHHNHGSNRRRLIAVLSLTLVYMLAEAIGGFLTNSLALLSDAGHMLADVASLILALLALWFAARPVTTRKTYGYYRMEILAALANGSALVVISLLIAYEAFHRIKSPEAVKGFEVTLIAIGGLAVNAVSAYVLHSASRENLNMRGAFFACDRRCAWVSRRDYRRRPGMEMGLGDRRSIDKRRNVFADHLQLVAAHPGIGKHLAGGYPITHRHSSGSRRYACGPRCYGRP